MQPRPRATTAFLFLTVAMLLSPVALADDPLERDLRTDGIALGLLPEPLQEPSIPAVTTSAPVMVVKTWSSDSDHDQSTEETDADRSDEEAPHDTLRMSDLLDNVDDPDSLVDDALTNVLRGLDGESDDKTEPDAPDADGPATTTGTDSNVIGDDVDAGLLAASAFTAVALGLAVAAAKKGLWVRLVSPLLAPLFSRFQGSDILDHPRRAELHQLVCRSPGVTVPDLAEATSLSRNTILHHLRMMQQNDMIVSERMGRSVHWYENGGRYGRERKAAYAVLQDARSRDVARFIAANPGTPQGAVAQALGLAPSVITWHVKRLEDAALVQRRRTGRSMHCFPQDILPSLAL